MAILKAGATTHTFKLNGFVWLISATLALGASRIALAESFFPPELLERQHGDYANSNAVDLSAYSQKDGQAPGVYRVDIIVSSRLAETSSVEFYLAQDERGQSVLKPCFSQSDLERLRIKPASLQDQRLNEKCVNLDSIPQAFSSFDVHHQVLTLSIPQAALYADARGYISPDRWDDGVNALMLNYSLNASNTYAKKSGIDNGNSQYLNLRPGLNLGAWRLRNYTTWNRDSTAENNKGDWNTVYTYAQRGISAIKSQLVLGESSSPSEVFDSVPFRGVQIASDDDMHPDSLKGYAPVVSGIARTNAEVIVRQNGYVIYQTYVAPGAFTVNDMYPTGGSGDLEVTVKESDGSEQHFNVPYASLPVMQRAGRLKYSLTTGQYRSYDSSIEKTWLGQFTAIYGLPYEISLYGGAQYTEDDRYRSGALGVGKNIGELGALSVDVTQSRARLPNEQETKSGQSYQVRYSKNMALTGTNVTVAGYRYSTKNYYTLGEVLDGYRSDGNYYSGWSDRPRNRTEVTLNQRLGPRAGTLSAYWVNENYWNDRRRTRSIGVSYGNNWNGIGYGINYSHSQNSRREYGKRVYDNDQIVSLNVSIPLSRWMSNTWANYNVASSKDNHTTHSVSLSGVALEGNSLSWSAQESYTTGGQGNGGNLSMDYLGTYGSTNLGYNYDKDQQRLNYGASGSLILHKNGLTAGQQLGDTAVLIAMPGAGGVAIGNQQGIKTDFRGYTVVPFASPYRETTLVLDTESLPDDVDFTDTAVKVVPTRGALVRADFSARLGNRVLMTLSHNGKPIPFGAVARIDNDDSEQGSIVGDRGQVYLSGVNPRGRLSVAWGDQKEQQCQVNYTLSEEKSQNGIVMYQAECL
ncbi:fimbria/pilus outer membrane usher protein [Leminorella grimontii]|uniref:fimbria/pilus outer membrane usher protein n=1 Tax=Leminorella grimontii TaxID=82981 RepID=UPI00208AA159|nr:fimbria/pilus outer membrane usher protein [Leminorella grimontii]GKX58955.1 fimbrial outer membrane usher protein SthC [Leminorella grimontii]